MTIRAAPLSSSSRNPHRGHQSLADTQRKTGCRGKFGVGGEVVLRQHLFEPHRRVLFACLRNLNRAVEVPVAMELHRDIHVVAELLLDLSRRGSIAVTHLCPRDVLASRLSGDRIEWPDLHRADAAVEQRSGKLDGLSR